MPLLVGVIVEVFVLLRIAGTPMMSYGGRGAQYHPHIPRLYAWSSIEAAFAGRQSLWDLPVTLDGDFPPGLHVLTGLLIAPFGHTLNAALASGMVWVFLLAASLGVLAGRLSTRTDGFDHRAGAAAATGLLLLASYQGFSLRYYYDVPFTALLYAGYALVVWGDGGRHRWWIAGGLVLALAAATKWTALPFGAAMGLGLLASAGDRRRRWATVGAGVVCAVVAGGYGLLLLRANEFSSFGSMFDTFDSAGRELDLWTTQRLGFYAAWTVRSVISPALAVLALPALLFWGRWRDGGWLIGGTIVGQLLFVVGAVPPLDERFVLTLVPMLALAAGLGIARMGRRTGMTLSALTVAVGLSVSWDFHFGQPGVFLLAEPDWRLDHWRKAGLSSAWNVDGGWARGDAPGQDCGALRERLWDLVQGCGLEVVGIGEREAPILGDGYWWSWRIADHDRRTAAAVHTRVIDTWTEVVDEERNPVEPELVLTTSRSAAPVEFDGVEVGRFAAPGCPAVHAIVVWAAAPRTACW